MRYFPEKGFGFIQADFGPDVFFHLSVLSGDGPPPEIEIGQPVKYELEPKEQRKHEDDEDSDEPRKSPSRRRAKLVELLDRPPGGTLEEAEKTLRHPKARKKKPTWRR